MVSLAVDGRFSPLCSERPTAKGCGRETTVSYVDRILHCRECGAEFVFSAGEQEFYAAKGLLNEPARCPECRSARRARLNGSYEASPRREMHQAICAECGTETMVPFLPRGDRPVYCSTCFDRVRAESRV
jgi:CxxC-x17-CxxC domain-containing protein